jgi:hypothetical protein
MINNDKTITQHHDGEIIKYRRPLKKEPRGSERSIFNRLDFLESHLGFSSGSWIKRKGVRLALWMWLATSIDTLIILSLSCLFMLGLVFTVRNVLPDEFNFLILRSNLKLTFFISFIFLGWMYFIATRALWSASVGEQTCSLRMGQPQERLQKTYLARVITRTTLTLLSGIIIIPLISLIFRQDLMGRLTCLNIYSLK